MRILLVSEYFYPQSSGGTELYVYNLAVSLQKQQHEVFILSVNNEVKENFTYKSLSVSYIPFNRNFQTSVITGEQPADNLSQFLAVIEAIKPNIIHFHTLTTSIGAFHVEIAKNAGFKVVLTSHIASHTCIRGNLIRLGKLICDGKVEEKKCLTCYLQHRKIPEPFNVIASFGIRFTQFPKNYASIVKHKQKELSILKISLNQLIVVSNWQQQIFIKNGFDQQKITLSRQAINTNKTLKSKETISKKLVLGFIGRISKIKGLHVLLASLKQIFTENIELRIAAIQVKDELDYYHQHKQQTEILPNCIWIENLPNENIGDFIQQLDILCVPSQGLETGPFVVYESLAQGVPVLGSDLGGIAELISEGKNGWLFPHQNEKYLGSLLTSFMAQKLEGKLLKDVKPIKRSIKNLAEEMIELYQKL